MWRVLFLFSIIPFAAALAARYWFALRVSAQDGNRPCRCDLEKWLPAPDDKAAVHRAENTAEEFGRQLRLKALAEWCERDPRAARSREANRRFGMAVPPLSAMVAVLAVIVAKIPILGALAIVLAATTLASALGVLALPPELQAIGRAARRVRETKVFPARDEEEAVVRCAVARAWKEALPPILGLIQR